MNQLSDPSTIPDQSADPLDQVFEVANPNPDRRDCPTPLVLRQLATRALPIGHPGYCHLTRCSACYRQFRALQRRLSSTLRSALAGR